MMTVNYHLEVKVEADAPLNETPLSLQEKLQRAIDESNQENISSNSKTMTLSPDFRMLDATGSRTANLDKLYKALVTIKPTSVESERAFSIGGNFCTKVRNRMAPSTLSALVSLKSYFKSFKQE